MIHPDLFSFFCASDLDQVGDQQGGYMELQIPGGHRAHVRHRAAQERNRALAVELFERQLGTDGNRHHIDLVP